MHNKLFYWNVHNPAGILYFNIKFIWNVFLIKTVQHCLIWTWSHGNVNIYFFGNIFSCINLWSCEKYEKNNRVEILIFTKKILSRKESCDLSCDISYISFYRSRSRHRMGTPGIINSQSLLYAAIFLPTCTVTSHSHVTSIFAFFFDLFAVLFLKTQTLSVNTITCYYGSAFWRLTQTLKLGVICSLAAPLDLLLYNKTCK